MRIFELSFERLSFDNPDDTWVRFEGNPESGIIVDSAHEPVLTSENVATLLEWLQGDYDKVLGSNSE